MPLDRDQVTYERRGAAALVTIDRQERRNAIDGPTAALLTEALERFEAGSEALVIVLTGAGELAFSAGADLKRSRPSGRGSRFPRARSAWGD